MNFRVSFILLVLAAVVGGYVLLFELRRLPETPPEAPWFYDIGFDEITNVSVAYKGQQQSFARKEVGWVFEDTGEPVNMDRWGGITLLLSGPRVARVVEEQFDNPAEYGLEPPESYITVTIKGGRQISFLLGSKTPDANANYAQVVGYPSLFLITSAWGDVINRLVTEPPVVTPIPQLAETTQE